MLELCALGKEPANALDLARRLGGIAYVTDDSDRPFRSLLRVATDDISDLEPCSDVGLYLVFSRQVKEHPVTWEPGQATPGIVGVYGMIAREDLGHRKADQHWRDRHAPLALKHHVGMWDYAQLSVISTLSGPAFDGFALCGFGSEQDFKERFFDSPEGKAAIRADIGMFADPTKSPRRVKATEWNFSVRSN